MKASEQNAKFMANCSDQLTQALVSNRCMFFPNYKVSIITVDSFLMTSFYRDNLFYLSPGNFNFYPCVLEKNGYFRKNSSIVLFDPFEFTLIEIRVKCFVPKAEFFLCSDYNVRK